MKKKIIPLYTWISATFFIIFTSLYVFVLIANPQTYVDKSGIHWHNITVKHNTPRTVTNYPSGTVSIDDPSIHVSVTKDLGVALMLFNQSSPYMGGIVAMAESDRRSVSEKGWDGFGIYFCLIEDVRQPDSWWTLMISLWYPIILFGILPAIFIIKKLRNRQTSFNQKSTIEKHIPLM